jgi:hypothetical protein
MEMLIWMLVIVIIAGILSVIIWFLAKTNFEGYLYMIGILIGLSIIGALIKYIVS